MGKSIDDATPQEWNQLRKKSSSKQKDNYEHTAEYYSEVDRNKPIRYNDSLEHYNEPLVPSNKSSDVFDITLYKFNEGELIDELRDYVNATYSEHYSKNKFQSTEFIIDCGHGEGFALGNVLKYVQRYGRKDGYNRKDLLKVLHYALIALHNHDLNNEESP